MSTPCFVAGSHLTKRPRVGDVVEVKFGPSVVVAVREHGMTLVLATRVHGTETVQRAKRGWWTVQEATPSA